MGLPIKVSIPKTQIRSEKGVFSRIYTVIPNQDYEIHACLSHGHEFTVYRRYKQFYLLNNEVNPIQMHNMIKSNRITLPAFPHKVWDSLNSDIINDRRFKLEVWLQATLMHYCLIPFVAKFLDIEENEYQVDSPDASFQNLTSDEAVIYDFIERINSKVKDRIRSLDEFDWLFFSKRRAVRPDCIAMLIHQIIPLCSDARLGSKALHLLYKFMSVDRNKDFQVAIREFVKVSPVVLRKIDLNLHVQNLVHGDSSQQAFHITKILADHYRSVRCEDLLREVLNYDSSAIDFFRNWESDSLVVRTIPKVNSTSNMDWRELRWTDFPGEFKIEYRFLNRELELQFEIQSCNTDILKVIAALTKPQQRKQWDLRLSSMTEIEETSGVFAMVYCLDNSLIDFIVESKVHNSPSHAQVSFFSVDHESSIENSQRCTCTISYSIEEVEDYESQTPESEPSEQPESIHSTPESEIDTSSANSVEIYNSPAIRIICSAKYNQLGSRLYIPDVLDEDRTLKDSLMLFKRCIEEEKIETPNMRKANSYSMLQALQTKSVFVPVNKKEKAESIGEDFTDDVEDAEEEEEDLLTIV